MFTKIKIPMIIVIVIIICLSIGLLCYRNIATTHNSKIARLVLPGNGDGISTRGINFIINKNVKFTQSEASVYAFKKPNITSSDVSKLARIVNLNEPVKEDLVPNRLSVTQGRRIFWMEKDTGKWAYEDLSKLYKTPKEPINMPSDEEAVKIATAEIKKFGLDVNSFQNGKVTYQTEKDATAKEPTIMAKDIYFYTKLNGKRVIGVSRVIVTVGNNGEVIGFSKFYKDIGNVSETVKLKSIDKVLKEIKKGNAIIRYDGKDSKIKELEVTSIDINYWEDPDSDYLQPVYVFTGINKNEPNCVFQAIANAF